MAETPRKRDHWDDETARLILKLPRSLKDWAMEYAGRKSTSVSQLIRDYLVYLKEEDDAHGKGQTL